MVSEVDTGLVKISGHNVSHQNLECDVKHAGGRFEPSVDLSHHSKSLSHNVTGLLTPSCLYDQLMLLHEVLEYEFSF